MIKPLISIIIPMLNESEIIVSKLQQMQSLRSCCELIVVDGGSYDDSFELAAPWVDLSLKSSAGRARQMNAGAMAAHSDLLLFLHLDTDLPHNLLECLPLVTDDSEYWGRFDVRIAGVHWMLPCIAFCMNWRSRITGVATGDQAIFVSRTLFNRIGGFPDQALMEDIELSARLYSLLRPRCIIKSKVITSGRRWEQSGVWRTIFLMWSLRLSYRMGESPDKLARRYGYRAEGSD